LYDKTQTTLFVWWRSIVVRPPVLPACCPYSCARLTAGRVTTLWVKRPLSVNQQGRLSLPSRGIAVTCKWVAIH